MVGGNIFIGNVTLENFLIFLFIFLLTVIAANISYALMRRLLDDKISVGSSKLISIVIQLTFKR